MVLPRKPPNYGAKQQAPEPPAPPAPKRKEQLKPCPPGHKRVKGKCVQKGVGPEYKP